MSRLFRYSDQESSQICRVIGFSGMAHRKPYYPWLDDVPSSSFDHITQADMSLILAEPLCFPVNLM